MRKVLSAQELATQLESQAPSVSLDEIVMPTADDLLALTQAAISDVEDVLPLTDDQREALRRALRQRLLGTLTNDAADRS
jgi:hypothetical protein